MKKKNKNCVYTDLIILGVLSTIENNFILTNREIKTGNWGPQFNRTHVEIIIIIIMICHVSR